MHDYEPLPWQKGLGYRVDETRCRAAVHEGGRGVGFHQCRRKPKDGGRYCSTHSPEAIKARQDASRKRYDDRRAAERSWSLRSYGAPLIVALQAIAKGHNDPRTLAAEVLAENGLSVE